MRFRKRIFFSLNPVYTMTLHGVLYFLCPALKIHFVPVLESLCGQEIELVFLLLYSIICAKHCFLTLKMKRYFGQWPKEERKKVLITHNVATIGTVPNDSGNFWIFWTAIVMILLQIRTISSLINTHLFCDTNSNLCSYLNLPDNIWQWNT